MEDQQIQSHYRIENVVLAESFFMRESKIEFEDIQLMIDHSSEVGELDIENKFVVSLILNVTGKQKDAIDAFTAKVKMIGVFEKIGEPAVSIDNFKKVNAPAILYPFVREHFHALCLKGNVGNVLLPTVNFKI